MRAKTPVESTPVEQAVEEATLDVQEFLAAVGADTLAPAEVETLAVGDIAWDPEDGFQDLLSDLNEQMNPSGDWDFPFYAFDVSTDLTRCLIADWESYGAFIAPFSVGDDREPTLSPRSDWTGVEQAWVESDEGFRALVDERRAAQAKLDAPEPAAVAPPTSSTQLRLENFSIIPGADGAWTLTPLSAASANSSSVVVFDGATSPDIPVEHQPGETLPNGEIAVASSMSWVATIVPEGAPTDDGRIFAPGAVSWRELPLSLGAMFDTPHADVVTASPVVGRIDEIWREGSMVYASGVFDDSDLGREVARMVSDGTLRGISVDVAVSKVEVAWKSEILDADGAWKGGDGTGGEGGPDLIDILLDPNPDDQVMYVIWEGKIGAVTICPFPAFAEASIKPASSLVAAASDLVWTVEQQHGMKIVESRSKAVGDPDAPGGTGAPAEGAEALTASVDAPVTPPAEWFDDPEFKELTSLQIDDDGRIYGHAAPWDTCHIGIPGVCTTAPRSETGYAYFHLKEVECDGGERISCGTISFGTGHANRNLSRVDAAAHYDNTGTAVADVVCGEDEHGIWYAGALRPGLDEATIRALRGAAVSGDWRNVNGNLEFVALLAVNVPGFPVPKVRAMVASGESGFEVLSLTAAGLHAGAPGFSRDDAAWFDALRDISDGGWTDVAAGIES